MKIDFRYPDNFLELLKTFKDNEVSPCSVLFNDNVVGGFIFNISLDDLSFFDIALDTFPQPHFKFRMLNFEHVAYAIEIVLIFENDRKLKFQIDPTFPIVKTLLKLLISNQKIAFHFYNHKTKLIASCFTNLDSEKLEWLERNNRLIKTLTNNGLNSSLVNNLARRMDENDKLFKFRGNTSSNQVFINNNAIIKYKSQN